MKKAVVGKILESTIGKVTEVIPFGDFVLRVTKSKRKTRLEVYILGEKYSEAFFSSYGDRQELERYVENLRCLSDRLAKYLDDFPDDDEEDGL